MDWHIYWLCHLLTKWYNGKMVLVVILFLNCNYSNCHFCFVVAIFDLVYDVEAKHCLW